VSDWERAKKFYGETLGLPVAYAVEQDGWLEYGKMGHPTLAINRWKGAAPMPPPGNTGIAVLEVSDVRAFIEDLRAKGVRCENVEEIPGDVILGTFYDPDGHRLQAAQSLYVPS
jgi:catechol 2,3-dioxygenase-like lactoylglutathione lyase family enzyme